MSIGSFNPGRDPDVDRHGYYLGQIIEPGGSFIADHTISNDFNIGDGAAGDKVVYFNLYGKNDSNDKNPAIRWNDAVPNKEIEFTYGGGTVPDWYHLQHVSAGFGINETDGADNEISVDVDDVIQTSSGLEKDSSTGKIKINLKTDGGLNFSAGELQCFFGSALDKYIVVYDGTAEKWIGLPPDSAGVVAKTGTQLIAGIKTFGDVTNYNSQANFSTITASSTAEFTNATFSSSASFSSDVTFEGVPLFESHLDIEEESTPANPPANTARLFAKDDGAGKTQLCVRFPSGAAMLIATEV